ncbi:MULTISPECIES: putative bifunctional diguanylate cyclase/phosphodiesterase [Pseudoalteromonas]|uniref:EAL domain-containing protein n=1 Tax=Pseudoalteromonas arctica TaxID=394751 RepID=A0ABU9TEI6_9GAMM|nr:MULTISPECIES: EAL domain-containing protein [Pseudoalteromonas]MBG9998291.1 EAL domain-containing protein [Pseudoalteromonas sp. NSLLW24]MBH0016767.1 EAL domain-containing protein [Pseudoalteromonas sp. NGC95]MBH0080238.1 EAL domain-containing protein [Pseudoalteromonas sp. NZS11]MDN3382160.1 EAL domain-containing protein [Pseudoalteromonas sp. APC 3358]NMP78736.1 EAL domain-containing protein [Pseudoalteromonas arctica]
MNAFKYLEAESPVNLARWHELERIMSDAMQNNYFKMVYQPLVSLGTGKLVGFESLVRCQSPRFGIVGPDEFIPHVEQSGMILELGDWIFEQCLSDLKQMRHFGMTDIAVSLNISPVQILDGDVFSKVMALLEKHQIPPQAIKVELTETALIHSPDKIAKAFENFHKEGVKVWIDDFGTGYASLGLLRQFDIDGLKIDRSFVSGIATNNEDFTLCSAIIAMAQRLGLQTVAEGIEENEQLQILEQLGCDIAQGYLLDKPQTLTKSIDTWAL